MATLTQASNKAYFKDKRDWFMNARFGMFVHWGLYAIAAEVDSKYQIYI